MNFCSELMGRVWSALSFCYEHWKPGTNFLIHHKGKQSDGDNLFVHHCKTFPNPFNFVMISGPIHLRVSPKKPAAPMSLSPGDVMDPIWEDYTDGGRNDQCISRRKMWIPPTNYGKNDEEFGFTLISFFLQRRFGSAPNCSTINSQCFLQQKSIPPRGGRKQTKEVWDNGRGYMRNVILCHNNQFKALTFLHSISHCPWMGISIKVEAHSSIMTGIPLPLHRSFNKQTKKTKDFPRTKVQRMRQVVKYGTVWQTSKILFFARLESTHSLHSRCFISVHWRHDRIVVS